MASISSLVIFVFKERGSCHCIRVHEKFYLFFLVVVVVVEVRETVPNASEATQIRTASRCYNLVQDS